MDAKLDIAQQCLGSTKDEKTPMLALLHQQRSNPSHSPGPRICGTLSHTAECAADEDT
jgi:hypothetical protein